MSKIGIAVIGCGDIARARYFPAIAGSPEFELVGVQSRTSSLCKPILEQYGGRIYPDLDALLRASELEAVVIATPHPSHAEIAIRSLEAGTCSAKSRSRRPSPTPVAF
jgi:predicted dehydrogenase